ncbi:MAG: hypothetical protein JWP02_3634, partial [Acidimicrobiales bacterium]|nr:hypothetical protein [Acidimicrobiales bacterium]
PLRVVGKAVLPPGIKSYGHNPELGQGAILDEASLGALIPPGFARPGPYTFAVRFADGVDKPRALARLFRDLRAKDENFVAVAPDTPATVVDFGHVTNLPLVLAGLLAAVAAATIAHLLVTSVRRRRRDLAVLKTLGFVPGQVRATVAWQATSLVAIAIAIGLPVGVALGRAVWGRFAANAGFVPEPVVPSLTTLLVIPGALLLANLVAAIPAWLAGRVPAAGVLRTE